MRISEAQKRKNLVALLNAALELFAEKGYDSTSMREISTRAGFSPGTIYSYFPDKEQIFFAYFDQQQDQLAASLTEIDDFETFSLTEKLQTTLESLLEGYAPQRPFVAETYKALLDSPFKSFSALAPIRRKYVTLVEGFVSQAVAGGTLPPQPFQRFLVNLFWDYSNLVVLYWLRDTSVMYTNTSQLIDLSLGIYLEVLRSGVASKVADTLSFLLKSQLQSNFGQLVDLAALVSRYRQSGEPNTSTPNVRKERE